MEEKVEAKKAMWSKAQLRRVWLSVLAYTFGTCCLAGLSMWLIHLTLHHYGASELSLLLAETFVQLGYMFVLFRGFVGIMNRAAQTVHNSLPATSEQTQREKAHLEGAGFDAQGILWNRIGSVHPVTQEQETLRR